MALTQVSTGGVKDDAITKAKIPANQIEASELADNAVDTNAIADDAITTAKIATSAITNTEIATGTISASRIVSGGLTAATLANDAITTDKVADDAITQAKINIPLSNRNIIINGAMNVAQRGTSSTSTGFRTCDRWQVGGNYNGTNTQSQADVGYTTTPYDKGFRKSLKVTNGNHSSANASDNIEITYSFEGDEIATSGWDYVSSSKKITLSFWVKSSVAQTFYGYFRTFPSVDLKYSFPIVCSTTNWEFKTVSIVGEGNFAQNVYNSFGNGTSRAMVLRIVPFYGTSYTDSGAVNNAWQNYGSTNITPVYDTSWFLTNGATFELTGVQLEVGDVNTEFEHRSFAQELALCQRYFFNVTGNNQQRTNIPAFANSSTSLRAMVSFPTPMRANPTFSGSATNIVFDAADDSDIFQCNALQAGGSMTNDSPHGMLIETTVSGMTAGQAGVLEFRANNGKLNFSAEL